MGINLAKEEDVRNTVLISLFFAALSLQYPETAEAEEGAIASLVVHNKSSSTIEYFYLSVDTPYNWGAEFIRLRSALHGLQNRR